eukprot:393698-Rhodomonas_salina.6
MEAMDKAEVRTLPSVRCMRCEMRGAEICVAPLPGREKSEEGRGAGYLPFQPTHTPSDARD